MFSLIGSFHPTMVVLPSGRHSSALIAPARATEVDMCLAIPGKVQSIRDDRRTRMATVEFGGVRKEICLAYLPEVAVDEYVIVHVGFAISKVDEASALETLQ